VIGRRAGPAVTSARPRGLTLRSRLALISAVAVALAILAASGAAWVLTRQVLREGVDRGLTSLPVTAVPDPGAAAGPGTGIISPEAICRADLGAAARLQGFVASIQLVRADGTSCSPSGMTGPTPSAVDIAAARGGPATRPRDVTGADGRHLRVLTAPWRPGYAVMVSRDLAEVEAALRRLAVMLSAVAGLGVLGAFGVGLVVARGGLRPIDQLTAAAEHVAATQDLDVPITVRGDDEVARLARAFNAMIDALTAARARQQQLVADASHELRTPLTSLRTNIDLLVRSQDVGRPLPDDVRQEVLTSVTGQLAELSDLVSELTVLADQEPVVDAADLAFADVVGRAVSRARRRGGHRWEVALRPCSVTGDPTLLERAVMNVLDNAVKYSPAGSTIRVELADGVLDVIDHGVGVPDDERGQVFDRFWRSPRSRSLPGSGLGLAIVADVVTRHGGQVGIGPTPGGGTTVTIRLPGAAPSP
jgi:two-component system, OmpR family, sensor histidine kinase MprB